MPDERRRLANRAAGVRAGRGGHEARRDRGRRAARAAARHARRGSTGCAPGRSTSSRSTSPSRTRPCWSCRPARCRRRPEALDDDARRTARRSSRACASRRSCCSPAVISTSLCAIGTPVSGPASPAGYGARRRPSPAASARFARRSCRNALSAGADASSMRSSAASRQLDARERFAAIAPQVARRAAATDRPLGRVLIR